MKSLRTLVLATSATLALSSPGWAVTLPGTGEIEQFRTALNLARERQFDQLDRLPRPARDPMAAYLEIHRLRAQGLPLDGVQRYLEQWSQVPVSRVLAQQALTRYGRDRNWGAFLALQPEPPQSVELACYYWQAAQVRHPAQYAEQVRQIWRHGSSRPDSCDPLFTDGRQRGLIGPAEFIDRIELALEQGNGSLADYLTRQLDEDHQVQVRQLRTLLNAPATIEQVHGQLPAARRDRWTRLAMDRLIQSDPAAGLATLDRLQTRHGTLQQDTVQALQRRVAWFATIRDLPALRPWLDDWLAEQGDAELLGQRARRAVIEQQWDEVLRWTAALPADQRNEARWQYWIGRAQQQLGQQDAATVALRQAAARRSFWGFAAADILGQDYALNRALPEPGTLPDDPALYRVAMLLAIDEPVLARGEWRALVQRSAPAEQNALARLARERGWHLLGIDAALLAGQHDAIDWRFPHAFLDQFQAMAARTGMDPWLLMAVSRRESSFNPSAQSHAGARGLMQLMPGTARLVARWLEEPAPRQEQLFEPDLSIRYGATYLKDLMERYQGNRLLALAAYNAGPSRVDQWLNPATVPFDVWVESIPFYETREYVQAVLSYRVILQKLDARPQQVSLMTPMERQRGYDVALLGHLDDAGRRSR